MAALSSRHYLELDGVRGLAILMVLAFHLSGGDPSVLAERVFSLGWCGVDLFFVLSGFLITGILIDSKSSDRYFKNFFLRRLRRIAPLYYTVIAAIFWVVIPVATRLGTLHAWTMIPASAQIWFWLPVSNIQSAFGYFAKEPAGHFWSLAVEEQFYLVWPLVVLNCSTARLMKVSAGIIAVSFLLRNQPFFLYVQSAYPEFLYRMTPFHMDGLAAGALIAAVLRTESAAEWAERWSRTGLWLSSFAAAFLVLYTQQTGIMDRAIVRLGYSAFALTFGFFVLHVRLIAGSQGALAAALRWAPLRSFGKYSYAIYVLHPLFAQQVRSAARGWLPHGYWPAISVPMGMSLSWCAGWCSWNLLEKHFLKTRPAPSEPQPPLNARLLAERRPPVVVLSIPQAPASRLTITRDHDSDRPKSVPSELC